MNDKDNHVDDPYFLVGVAIVDDDDDEDEDEYEDDDDLNFTWKSCRRRCVFPGRRCGRCGRSSGAKAELKSDAGANPCPTRRDVSDPSSASVDKCQASTAVFLPQLV